MEAPPAEGFLVPRGTGLQVNAVNNPTSTKNKNKKYDNPTFKETNRPVASADQLPRDYACARVLCAFANGASG